MDDYDMKLIFRQSPDAGEMPYAIEELTYLVQAIAQREDARRRSHRFEFDCHHGIAEDLCQSLFFALVGRDPSEEDLSQIVPRDPALPRSR